MPNTWAFFHTSHSLSTEAAVFSPACEGGEETGLGRMDVIRQQTLLTPSLHLACLAPLLGPSWLQLSHCKGPVSSQSPSQLESWLARDESPSLSKDSSPQEKDFVNSKSPNMSIDALSIWSVCTPLVGTFSRRPPSPFGCFLKFSVFYQTGKSRDRWILGEQGPHPLLPVQIPAELLFSKTLQGFVMRTPFEISGVFSIGFFSERKKLWNLALSIRKENISKAPVLRGKCQDTEVTRSSARQSQGEPLSFLGKNGPHAPCTGSTTHWVQIQQALPRAPNSELGLHVAERQSEFY